METESELKHHQSDSILTLTMKNINTTTANHAPTAETSLLTGATEIKTHSILASTGSAITIPEKHQTSDHHSVIFAKRFVHFVTDTTNGNGFAPIQPLYDNTIHEGLAFHLALVMIGMKTGGQTFAFYTTKIQQSSSTYPVSST